MHKTGRCMRLTGCIWEGGRTALNLLRWEGKAPCPLDLLTGYRIAKVRAVVYGEESSIVFWPRERGSGLKLHRSIKKKIILIWLTALSIVVPKARLRLIFQILWNHIMPLLFSATVLRYPFPVSFSGKPHRLSIPNTGVPRPESQTGPHPTHLTRIRLSLRQYIHRRHLGSCCLRLPTIQLLCLCPLLPSHPLYQRTEEDLNGSIFPSLQGGVSCSHPMHYNGVSPWYDSDLYTPRHGSPLQFHPFSCLWMTISNEHPQSRTRFRGFTASLVK